MNNLYNFNQQNNKKRHKREADLSHSDPVKWLGREFLRFEEENRHKTLILNEQQLNKYLKAVEFLNRHDGQIVSYSEPEELHGGLTADFTSLQFSGDETKEFMDILSTASAFSIDSLLNGRLEVSFTIPNVFVVVEDYKTEVKMDKDIFDVDRNGKLDFIDAEILGVDDDDIVDPTNDDEDDFEDEDDFDEYDEDNFDNEEDLDLEDDEDEDDDF